MPVETVGFDRLCEITGHEPALLRIIVKRQDQQYGCDGWFVAEAQLMDSGWFGSRVVLPYGPNNTFKSPPSQPFSPRGLASDTSVVIAVMPKRTMHLPQDKQHQWYTTLFCGNMVCSRCGLLPLDEDDLELECSGVKLGDVAVEDDGSVMECDHCHQPLIRGDRGFSCGTEGCPGSGA